MSHIYLLVITVFLDPETKLMTLGNAVLVDDYPEAIKQAKIQTRMMLLNHRDESKLTEGQKTDLEILLDLVDENGYESPDGQWSVFIGGAETVS